MTTASSAGRWLLGQTVQPDNASFFCTIKRLSLMALTSGETNWNLINPQISPGWHCRETQVQFYLNCECLNICSIIDCSCCVFSRFLSPCYVLIFHFVLVIGICVFYCGFQCVIIILVIPLLKLRHSVCSITRGRRPGHLLVF